MTLEKFQHEMRKVLDEVDWEAWEVLHSCEEMIQSYFNPKSIKAFYEIGESFIGKARMLRTLNRDYPYKQHQILRDFIGV